MIGPHPKKRFAVALLAVLAAFALIYHTGKEVKPFDAIIFVLGLFLVLDKDVREMIKDARHEVLLYGKYFIVLIFFIAFGQIVAYFFRDSGYDPASFLNYGRVLFNSAIFLLVAFLVSHYRNLLVYISWAVFIAPLVVLPARIIGVESFYTNGGRLTGFLQNPIIFSFWMAVVFVIGLGLFFHSKQWWVKGAVAAWLCVLASFILWGGSRASWLALFLGLILLCVAYFRIQGWRQKALVVVVLVFLAFSVGYFFLPDNNLKIRPVMRERVQQFITRPFAAQLQTTIWQSALPFTLKNWLGIGFGGERPTFEIKVGERVALTQATSNSFLEVMFYGGIGALAAFLVILAKLFRDIDVSLRKNVNRVFFDLRLAWAIVAPLAIFDVFFNDGFLWRHLWFALGMSLGTVWLDQVPYEDKVLT